MAAEEESENRFYIPCAGSHPHALPAWQKSNSLSSQTRQTGTETRNSNALTQETSPERQQTCSGWAACTLSPAAKSCRRHGPAGRRSRAAPTLSPSPMALPWIYFLPSEQPVAQTIKPGNNISRVVLNTTKSHLACSTVRLFVLTFIHPLFISLSRKRLFFASSRREILRLLKLKLSKGHWCWLWRLKMILFPIRLLISWLELKLTWLFHFLPGNSKLIFSFSTRILNGIVSWWTTSHS